ncbi:MAG: hypothetical protein ABFS86_06465 [Planctomycetota bacterium]
MRIAACAFALLALSVPVLAEEGTSTRIGETEFSITLDEILTWLAIGILVASLVLLVGNLGSRKMGRSVSLILGLIGAAAGGFAVDFFRIDLHLGAIVIYYDTLLAATAGALILLILPRLMSGKNKKS